MSTKNKWGGGQRVTHHAKCMDTTQNLGLQDLPLLPFPDLNRNWKELIKFSSDDGCRLSRNVLY